MSFIRVGLRWLYSIWNWRMMQVVKTLLSAAYVATMAGAVILDGAVVFDEQRVIAVGEGKGVRERHADADLVELGEALVLPGLVNAHVHLELTAVGQLARPASFVDWILALRKSNEGVSDPEVAVRQSIVDGIDQCWRFGVTAVGDISLNPSISRPLLGMAGMRGVSFGEVLGMASRAKQMEFRLAVGMDRTFETPFLRMGLGPHAPYSLDLTGYRRCLEAARENGMPLSTHLAETADEAAFLADHAGPFRALWETLGAWSDGVSRAAGGPIRVMRDLGLLDYPTVLAHVNYADDDELEILARSKASVVYCPRTHAYFGHAAHRFEELLRGGINVAIGTDSCASSPDLNLVDDLRLVYRQRPHLQPELLWGMVTHRAALALGKENMIGRIAPGALADFCVFDVHSRDPLREILENDVLPRQVWIGGVVAQSFAGKAAALREFPPCCG